MERHHTALVNVHWSIKQHANWFPAGRIAESRYLVSYAVMHVDTPYSKWKACRLYVSQHVSKSKAIIQQSHPLKSPASTLRQGNVCHEITRN